MAGLSAVGGGATAALAWCLGAVDLLFALGWLVLAVCASRFRASFGASPVRVGLVVAPVLGFGWLATMAWLAEPGWLLASAFGGAVLLAVALLPVLGKAPYVVVGALLHAAAWGALYAQSRVG